MPRPSSLAVPRRSVRSASSTTSPVVSVRSEVQITVSTSARPRPAGARALLLALAAALAALVLAPAAHAAAPVIENGGNWLETPTLTNAAATDRVRLSLTVSHDPGRRVTGIRFVGPKGATQTVAVTSQQPITRPDMVTGGLDYSRVTVDFTTETNLSDFSCNFFGGSGTRSVSKTVQVAAVLDDNVSSAQRSATMQVIAGNAAVCEDYAYITAASPQPGVLTPGQSYTFRFTGDAPDANGTYAEFSGVRWRMRRLSDGATTAEQTQCYPTSQWDNQQKALEVTFARRGRWVVEARPTYGSGCGTVDTRWHWIGAADVNTAAATSPTLSLSPSVQRPRTGQPVTATATFADAADAGQGGGVQTLEWNADGDNAYESAVLGSTTAAPTPRTISIPTAGLAPGVKTVQARVRDNGAMSAADASARTTVATTTFRVNAPPVADGGGATVRTGERTALTLPGTDADADQLEYTILDEPANGTLTGEAGARTYAPDPGFAGVDTVRYRVSDGYGGADENSVTISVAPDTAIDARPPAASNQPTETARFSSSVDGASFECRLDEGPWRPCASPYETPELVEGAHALEVRAVVDDIADPRPAATSWRTLLTAPTTTIASGPEGLTKDASPSFAFTATTAGSTFRCRIDDEAVADCTSPQAYEDLADGQHTFAVRATDPAGNVEEEPVVQTFVVDTRAPVATIQDGPADVAKETTATFSVSADEDGATLSCRLDDGAAAPCADEVSYADLVEGEHTLTVLATDRAGNVSEETTRTWTVDTTAPTATITGGPADRTRSRTATFGVSADEPATLVCRLDEEPAEDCGEGAASYADLEDGEHALTVVATDRAGNVSEETTRTWTVDTVRPEVTITGGPDALTRQTTATFGIAADKAGTTLTCRIDDEDAEDCTDEVTYADLGDGERTLTVVATDPLGNATTATRTWTVDTVAPTATIDRAPDGETAATTAAFGFTADEDEVTFSCRLDPADEDAAWEPCEEDPTFSDLADGEHRLDVRATDRAGNDGATATHRWSIDTVKPVVTLSGGPEEGERTRSTSAAFTATADKAGSQLECRLDGEAYDACPSPLEVDRLGDGEHRLDVRATDRLGNEGEATTRTWMVDTTGPATRITAGPDGPTRETAGRFAVASDAADVARYDCRFDDEDWTDCTTEASSPLVGAAGFSGLEEGDRTFRVRATDDLGNEGETVTRDFTIDTTAPAVSFSSGPADGTAETAVTIGFAVDDEDAAVTCAIDGAAVASCASPQALTGLVPGTHRFEVSATDAAGNVGTRAYAWTQAAPPSPQQPQPQQPEPSVPPASTPTPAPAPAVQGGGSLGTAGQQARPTVAAPRIARRSRALRIGTGRYALGSVRCGGEACSVRVRTLGRVRVRGRTLDVRVAATRPTARRASAIRLVVPAAARRAVRGRSVRVRVRIEVRTPSGTVTRTWRVPVPAR